MTDNYYGVDAPPAPPDDVGAGGGGGGSQQQVEEDRTAADVLDTKPKSWTKHASFTPR